MTVNPKLKISFILNNDCSERCVTENQSATDDIKDPISEDYYSRMSGGKYPLLKSFVGKFRLDKGGPNLTINKFPFSTKNGRVNFNRRKMFSSFNHYSWSKRKYVCDCNKEFSSGGSLRKHTSNIHNADFPHRCYKCGRGFNLLSAMNPHMKKCIYRYLECDVCGLRLKDRRGLVIHMKVHKLKLRDDV